MTYIYADRAFLQDPRGWKALKPKSHAALIYPGTNTHFFSEKYEKLYEVFSGVCMVGLVQFT